jgi:hypothetical protein
MAEYRNLERAHALMLFDGGYDSELFPKLDFSSEELEVVDLLLADLSQQDFDTLCIGDQDHWVPIFEKIGPNADLVHRVLDKIFNKMMRIE